jgi:acyl-coenzyme A synthetase/AMP-(fatty) acid ligase
MIKVDGLWVSPFEVEAALITHAAVWQAAVIGYPDETGLLKPKAFVVTREGIEHSPELARELQQQVQDRLARYQHPRWIEFVPELPLTPTQKIQRFKLRERDSANPHR